MLLITESSTPADAVDQADAELEAAVSISGILGKASRTAAGVEGAFPGKRQLHRRRRIRCSAGEGVLAEG